MGVASILDARKVFLLAFGEHKAPVVYKAAELAPTEAVTASFLQEHPDATFVLDAAAAAELTAVKRPWEVGPCEWTPEVTRRAVVHLAYENPPYGENTIFTVTYKRGDNHKPEGSLVAGDSVKVKEGVVFNVVATDKS